MRCFCLCSGLRLGSTFQLGNRQEVPREPREGPEHLGRRRVPSNNRYSGRVESPSSSRLPRERSSGDAQRTRVHPVQVGVVAFLVLYHAMFSELGADDSDGHEATRTACATLPHSTSRGIATLKMWYSSRRTRFFHSQNVWRLLESSLSGVNLESSLLEVQYHLSTPRR